MTSSPRKLSVSQLSLYNPSRLSDEDIIASFAVRQAVYERILADITAEAPRSRAQHHLVVGQRGMGKTTLLARLAAELRQVPSHATKFIPLAFAEEQYAVDRLSRFWLNCLDSLADACERAGNSAATVRIDEAVQQLSARVGASAAQDDVPATEALEAFLGEAKTLGLRPVLFVDNLQLVFERISPQQQHVLRELLMRPGAPILIGASPSPPPESQDYGAAFYDHFKVHYLSALSVEEMRQLMLVLAEKVGRDDVRDRIQKHPHRLSVLRQLTGGNPRTTVTLFFLYAEDFAPSVFGDLENLLDRVTPLYKARFEELSQQQQVVASALANHWDPATARTLAEATGLPITGISPQLDRLEKIGFVERVTLFGESSIGFQIAERFFNVWFLMRSASRRQRREVEFLTRFIESFYESQDRRRLARHLQSECNFSPDRQLFARALSSTLEKPEGRDLRRHAELDALRQREEEARRRLEDVIDFTQLPPATLAFDALRTKLVSLVPKDAGIDPEAFSNKVLGDRQMFVSGDRGRLAARGSLTVEEIQKVLASVRADRERDVAEYGEDAVRWIEGRLSSGKLACLEDGEDWETAIFQAAESQAIQTLVDSIPPAQARRLPEAAFRRVQQSLQPSNTSDARAWSRWAHRLNVDFERPEEAEKAYREAIQRDGKDAVPWFNLGKLLCIRLRRYEEAEKAYREAIRRDEMYASPWIGLGNLFCDHLGRCEEAEKAYREAIQRDEKDAVPWFNLGHLLSNQLGRIEEAEKAYREAIQRDNEDALAWNNLGNLLCDHLGRFAESVEAFGKSAALDPEHESPRHNLMFLRRDFLGEAGAAKGFLEGLLSGMPSECPDTLHLHQALFAAYDQNWGLACESLERALSHTSKGFPANTSDDWFRASAVLLHLNLGEPLLRFLKERGDQTRMRPWYEALAALHAGDRRYLQNLAPEIRVTAEAYFDQIEKRLNLLPEKTRRRPMPPALKAIRRRRGSTGSR